MISRQAPYSLADTRVHMFDLRLVILVHSFVVALWWQPVIDVQWLDKSYIVWQVTCGELSFRATAG